MRKFLRSVKNAVFTFTLRPVARLGMYKKFIPAKGSIHFGDFDTTTPFSKAFGYDRGGPVDRYYIEGFLEKNSALVKGRVMEIEHDDYTLRFGGAKVEISDILYIDDTNPKATIVADLTDASNIADNLFDCIILTQTLHMIYDTKAVLANCFRILKPGGSLLMTVPGISNIDYNQWEDYWYWSFTKKALTLLLGDHFPVSHLTLETYGNVKTAAAFLYGVGLPEMKKSDMTYNDPNYQVIISAIATKPI